MNLARSSLLGAALLLTLGGCCRARCCPAPQAPVGSSVVVLPAQAAGLDHVVAFRLGANELRGGDAIEITGLRGDRPRLEVGGTYCAWGTVTRAAGAASANLMVWNSGGENAVEEPRQVTAGPGTQAFVFRFRVLRLGAPHLSLYPPEGGSSLGGLYFHPAS